MKQTINELLNYECKALGLLLDDNQDALQGVTQERMGEVVTAFGLGSTEVEAYLSEVSKELLTRDVEYLSVAYLRVEFFAYWLKRQLDFKLKWRLTTPIPCLSELASIYELATILHQAEAELKKDEDLMQ